MSEAMPAGATHALNRIEHERPCYGASELSPRNGDILAAALASLVEGLTFAAGILYGYHWIWLAVGHGMVVGALLARLAVLANTNTDTTNACLTLLMTGIVGPVGAGLILIWLPFSGRGDTDGRLLSLWYERITRSTETGLSERLAENVGSGRTLDTSAPPAMAFGRVLAVGTLEQRQSALGLIARQFHLDYAPALAAALSADEPVLRAQAAAVAVRVRGLVAAQARRHIQSVSEPALGHSQALAAADWLARAVAAGLLDGPLAREAETAAGLLANRGLEGDLIGLDPIAARKAENELLRRGRFGDFRLLRRLRSLRAERGARVRRLGRPRPRRTRREPRS